MSENSTLLPRLDLSAIARAVATKTPNSDIKAQLLFIAGQYLLVYLDKEGTAYKFLSPAQLRQAFSREPVDSGYFPSQTVRWGKCNGEEWLVQFYPFGPYCLSLDSTPLTVTLPSFIFVGCGRRYWIWATKQSKFQPKCQLFHAPLPNVMVAGNICFGNNSPPICCPTTIAAAWELFWCSPFGRDAVQNKSRSHPHDVRQQLLQLEQQRSSKYPLRDLVRLSDSLDRTLAEILRW